MPPNMNARGRCTPCPPFAPYCLYNCGKITVGYNCGKNSVFFFKQRYNDLNHPNQNKIYYFCYTVKSVSFYK